MIMFSDSGCPGRQKQGRRNVEAVSRCPWGGDSKSFSLPIQNSRGVGVQGEADVDQGLMSQTKACCLLQGVPLIALGSLPPFAQVGTHRYHVQKPKSKTKTE